MDVYHTSTRCGLSANLECRSEMCCTWLVENTGCKSYAKIRHLRTFAQRCLAIIRNEGMCRQSKKNLLNNNISFTCPHNMVNFGQLTVESGWRVWGTRANFEGFASWLRYCTDVAQRRSIKLRTCLAVSWAGTLYVHFGGSCP